MMDRSSPAQARLVAAPKELGRDGAEGAYLDPDLRNEPLDQGHR